MTSFYYINLFATLATLATLGKFGAMKTATPAYQQSHHYLAEFLDPLTAVLGRSERRVGALRYLLGLLLPGERKSIEPMAQRLGVDPQSLQQFVSDSPWDDGALWKEIRDKVIPTR